MSVDFASHFNISSGTIQFSGSGNRTVTFTGVGSLLAKADAVTGQLISPFGAGSILIADNRLTVLASVNSASQATVAFDWAGSTSPGLAYLLFAPSQQSSLIADLIKLAGNKGGVLNPFKELVYDDGALRLRLVTSGSVIQLYVGATKSAGTETATILGWSIDTVTGAVTIGAPRRTVGDTAVTVAAADRNIALTAALTAARTVTLPAANAVPAGTAIALYDEAGSLSSTLTWTITRAGSDTIDGATTLALSNPYEGATLRSDGTSKWTVAIVSVNAGGTGARDKTNAQRNLGLRERLTGNKTLYVRSTPAPVTISVASPAVITWTGHGLQANDPVVFSIPPNTKAATLTVASPCVATVTGHGFVAGQPIVFGSFGRLPKGVTAGTTYYVLASGLTTNTFQFALTAGGAAINTTAPTFTVTIASPGVFTSTAHGLSVGDIVYLATTGALPTGTATATAYFVKTTPTADTFTVSATPEGAAINTTGTQSGTHTLVQGGTHECEAVGTMPTGATDGTVYYAKTILDTNTLTFSATPGGAAINTTVAGTASITACTGNDGNDGSAATRAGALLTLDKARTLAFGNYDLAGYNITIQAAESTYTAAFGVDCRAPQVGAGQITVKGNNSVPGNCKLTATYGCVTSYGNATVIGIQGFRLKCTSVGAQLSANYGGLIEFGFVEFDACPGTWHIEGYFDAAIKNRIGAYRIIGGGIRHLQIGVGSTIDIGFIATSLRDQPVFSAYVVGDGGGKLFSIGQSFTGFAKGARFSTYTNSILNFNGSTMPGDSAGVVSGGIWY